ncbi:MAG: PAS domain-containing protein [Aphanothece sp. CMT-3BRIN-NPC111]|jgi:PAS domain S-box-containing protein|nr:PAS domain-containing protein [Aphanothece sp. CMT-3BRIN-NPC111]
MEDILKILVVEDDEVDRMAVRRALKSAGVQMQLSEVEDCARAIAALGEQSFDCVFIDYRLPDGDALALVNNVRRAGFKVPLVVLTGQGDEQIAVELMKAGAADYISKGKLSPESLSRSLRNAVRVYRAEMQAYLVTERLRESEERYRLVVEGSNDGIWDWDISANQLYWNERLFEITGLSPGKFTPSYEDFLQLLHPEDRQGVVDAVTNHLKHQIPYNEEFRLLHTSGEYRYCLARGKAQLDINGKPLRMSGIISDITERKRTEESQRFLAEASILLSASLDYQTTLENLAQLAVPRLADWCAIDVIEPDKSYRRIAVAHVNPGKEELVWELQHRYPAKANGNYGYGKVLRTGESDGCFDLSDSLLLDLAEDDGHLKLLRELNIKSYICVPLRVWERTLGSILFVSAESGRRYTEADLRLAEDMARRAALAVENARLYREAQEASTNLRQAILILGEQQQQLRTLQQLTNLLNQRLTDLPGLLRVMVQAVCDAIAGAQFCFIILNNPQCNRLVLSVTAGIGTEKLRLEDAFAPEGGLLSHVFATGEAQAIQAPSYDLTSELPALIYAVPIESVQAGRLGVLAIGNWKDADAFDMEDKNLLAAVGEQAAIAIDNARQINTLEEREERLELQNEILAQQNQELENQRQQIQLQNLQLMEAARLKSHFLATMSHELRTPMNAIIGFSQLLLRQRQNKLMPQQVDMMERILNNGRHLLTLINEILDLSKIEAGRMELQLEELNLLHLVKATTEELRSLSQEKHLKLHIRSDLSNPCIINDRSRLRQILVNLLSNAIKFTETGSVQIEVKEITTDLVSIIVKDTGIGIAENDLKHIFEEFRQLDQSLKRKYEGTGLGLAIVNSLVQLMQGKISVESTLGEGSTFCVELPRKIEVV